jgi:hypothetical protein
MAMQHTVLVAIVVPLSRWVSACALGAPIGVAARAFSPSILPFVVRLTLPSNLTNVTMVTRGGRYLMTAAS